MRVVWKCPLRSWSIFLDVPKGATILSVGAQEESGLVVWALCDPEAPKVPRIVTSVATGEPLPPALAEARFLGTVQMGLVFHIFDGGERAT